MSYSWLSAPHESRYRPPLAALGLVLVILFGSPAGAVAQFNYDWTSTDDQYDTSRVESRLDQLRQQLAERHGPLAETLFEMNADLARWPDFHGAPSRGPRAEPIRYRVEASHLMHYQALNGGTLGKLHGTSSHPVGVGWMPHSMFAQSGRLYGEWGHARLLAAVDEFKDRHRD
ncbi:MAG: hypothetical protein ACC682_12945 [Gemmatimonadota bacterium]